MEKSADAFRTISEVGEELGLPQHVLRFWETRFVQIKPLKRGGGRRYYRPDDVELVRAIKHLLYGEGYTIKGVQRILKEQGVKALIAASREAKGASALFAGEAAAPIRQAALDFEDEGQNGFAEAAPAEAAPPVNSNRPPDAKIYAARLRDALAEIEECQRLLGRALDS